MLTFFILPGIVAALTPFTFRDVFRVSQSTLLLIFVTGKIILVMPQMIENVKELFRTRTPLDADGKFLEADLIVPLIYPFPNLGTFVIFMFIPFTAWFVDNPMDASNYPVFLGATLLVSFVAPVIGIPFLLDLLKLPNDMFHLFVVSSVYTDRVRVVLGGMHVFVFAVLVVAALHGLLRIHWNRAVRYAGGSLALAAISALGVYAFLGKTLEGSYTKDKVVVGMQLLERPAESGVLRRPAQIRSRSTWREPSRRVRRRRVLRFGYDLQRIPFCFPNSRGEIVGYDVELMHRFAETLQVRLEFVPVSRATLPEQAAADHFDVAGCGFTLTSARAANFALSQPYLDLHAVLVVPDHRRHDFASAAELSREAGLTIGVAAEEESAELLREWIPRANIVRLGNAKDFFAGAKPGYRCAVYQCRSRFRHDAGVPELCGRDSCGMEHCESYSFTPLEDRCCDPAVSCL